MADFLPVMWNHRCTQCVWSDSGRESWWCGRWPVKKIKAKTSTRSPKYLCLSTTQEIRVKWRSAGFGPVGETGRSLKTSDMTACVHQRAEFRFILFNPPKHRPCRKAWAVLRVLRYLFESYISEIEIGVFFSLNIVIRLLPAVTGHPSRKHSGVSNQLNTLVI